MLTFLDLPHTKTYRRVAMPVIKEDVGDIIQNVAQLFLFKGLEGVGITLEEKYMEWEAKRATTEFSGENLLPTMSGRFFHNKKF
eukprot:11535329-Ditylum_brightwellii.AAC.1